MAQDPPPIDPDDLRQVLDRLDDVLGEAARLRKEVIRQLSEERGRQQQHISSKANSRKRKTSRKR